MYIMQIQMQYRQKAKHKKNHTQVTCNNKIAYCTKGLITHESILILMEKINNCIILQNTRLPDITTNIIFI